MPGHDKNNTRKTAPWRLADFDDQLWPVNCAILILAGIVSGLAVASGDFHSTNPLENTTLRLVLTALVAVLLFAGTFWLEGRLVRRLQLCVLVSLMVHLWLGIYLHQRYITIMAALREKEQVVQIAKDDPRLTVPEYHWQRIDRPLSRPSFEQPTETEAARPADPEPVEQRQIEHDVKSHKPKAKPDQPRPQQPKPAEIRRAELTAPRRAKLAAGTQISRQQWKQQPLPNRPIPQPKITDARQNPALQQAEVSPLRQKASKPARQQRQVFDVEPADPVARKPVRPARRATQNESPATTDRIGVASLSRVARHESPSADISSGIHSPARRSGPAMSPAAEVGAGPLRKTSSPGLLPGLADIAEPGAFASAEPSQTPTSPFHRMGLTAGTADSQPRRPLGGLSVRIAAASGPGGLSYEPSPEIGIPTRRARPESEVVHTDTRRFLVERSGGRLPVDGDVQGPAAEAFRQRDPGRRARAVEVYGGSEAAERAVELGLDFFVRRQFPDGHWSLHRHKPQSNNNGGDHNGGPDATGSAQTSSDTAATGLALLSFFGAGYTHQTDKHRDTVRRGIEWLVKSQKPDGDLFTGGTDYTWFYSHGIAAIALCEAYGMTNDPDLRDPAQKAIGFIVASQHPSRGGWRYKPQTESDTSVSGWQLMALKSAQMAGLEVPAETLEKVSHWLDTAQVQGGSRFVYNPNAPDAGRQRQDRRPNLAMTAEGTLMRMYLGRKSGHPATTGAADYLADNLPELDTRDAYYWYYATQVMFHMQGDYWKVWNQRLRPILEKSQQQNGPLAGSWDPAGPTPDRWGHAGGRIYLTAMNLLMLEVYYRHLPLFQTLKE